MVEMDVQPEGELTSKGYVQVKVMFKLEGRGGVKMM